MDDRTIKKARIIIPTFRYIQIAESLLDWIGKEKIKPGTRLPPERELSQSLGVNRATLRQALNILEEQGLIFRRQGQGTFVAEPKIERQAGKLVPFTKSMQKKGYLIEGRLIAFEKITTEAFLADELQISIGQPAYFIHRLRMINHEPVLIEKLIVPEKYFPNMDQFDLASRSLYEVMEHEYDVSVIHARQSLEPVVATEYESELLGINPGAPLMLERRLAYDQYARPVERARDLFRGDRFRFVTEMAPLDFT